MIKIREATDNDLDKTWEIFQEVIKTGDTYVFSPETTKQEFTNIWYGNGVYTYVAEYNDSISGTYVFKSNFPGLGSHVCNASYMVHPEFFGKGIGRAMGNHSFKEAAEKGYTAMQFNIVVSTNESAVKLWKSLGFKIIGTSPKAFNHNALGLVDTYIMHRFLTEL